MAMTQNSKTILFVIFILSMYFLLLLIGIML